MPNYSIEARSLGILGGVAGHDFWVLRDEQGNAVAELHGLATDRETGEVLTVGTDEDKHSLRVWHYAHDPDYARSIGAQVDTTTYIREGQPSRTVLTADSEEVLARWNSAVSAAPALNAEDLDYPRYGFKLFGGAINSNSTYRTLGEIMGVQVRDFDGRMEPGVNNRMVPPERIEELRIHGYPVLDEPRIDAAERRADLSNLTPSDRAYFEALRAKLPQGTADNAALDALYRAKQAGIPLESFHDVALVGDRAYVLGRTPGFRVEIDLATTTPASITVDRLSAEAPLARPEIEQAERLRSGPMIA